MGSQAISDTERNLIRGPGRMNTVDMNRTSPEPHVGHVTPFGQRSSTIVRSALSGSAKYLMASVRVWGSVLMAGTIQDRDY